METKTKRPGSALIGGGLLLAAVSVLLIAAILAGGGHLTIWTVGGVLLGLVLAGVGFGVRVLAALETR